MAERSTHTPRPVTVEDGTEPALDMQKTFQFGWSDTYVNQQSRVQNTMNISNTNAGFFGGLKDGGAETLVLGLLGIGVLVVVGFGMSKTIKRKRG